MSARLVSGCVGNGKTRAGRALMQQLGVDEEGKSCSCCHTTWRLCCCCWWWWVLLAVMVVLLLLQQVLVPPPLHCFCWLCGWAAAAPSAAGETPDKS
jgi:hypothetical protein